jgi:hypothetical protein
MKARVFVLPGGKIQIFVDEGTFEEAQALTKLIIGRLQAAGLPIEQTSEIEMHRDGVEHVHVQEEVSHDQ